MSQQAFESYLSGLAKMGMDNNSLSMYQKQLAEMLQTEMHPQPFAAIDLEAFFADTDDPDNETD